MVEISKGEQPTIVFLFYTKSWTVFIIQVIIYVFINISVEELL